MIIYRLYYNNARRCTIYGGLMNVKTQTINSRQWNYSIILLLYGFLYFENSSEKRFQDVW